MDALDNIQRPLLTAFCHLGWVHCIQRHANLKAEEIPHHLSLAASASYALVDPAFETTYIFLLTIRS
ncbi:hypothetical protein Hanom_Chr01g00061511 [Helianthus anomalus]